MRSKISLDSPNQVLPGLSRASQARSALCGSRILAAGKDLLEQRIGRIEGILGVTLN
jgi:hypothetical protein